MYIKKMMKETEGGTEGVFGLDNQIEVANAVRSNIVKTYEHRRFLLLQYSNTPKPLKHNSLKVRGLAGPYY